MSNASQPPDCAVIFDVDGVLLELTRAEEELFFVPFTKWLDTAKLSRDWNSYRVRNDDNIIDEILECYAIPSTVKPALITEYVNLLTQSIKTQTIETKTIPGALHLLAELRGTARLGIATANLCAAAKLRLEAAGLWEPVSRHAFGADGGGHKHEILARVIDTLDLPKSRIVYIGDNRNDVEAGLRNGVKFIGFSTDAGRRAELARHGATHVTATHDENLSLIQQMLARC